MNKASEEDLRVADNVLDCEDADCLIGSHRGAVKRRIATAITAARAEQREVDARVIESYAQNAPTVCQQAAAEIRAGSKTKVFSREDEQKNLGR